MGTRGAGSGSGGGGVSASPAGGRATAAAARLVAAMLDLPVPVRVRESRRATAVLMRLLPASGLEIVVPAGFRMELVPLAVESRRSWIETAMARLAASGELPGALPVTLPGRLVFTAFGLEYRVDYVSRRGAGGGGRQPLVREMGPGRLVAALPAEEDGEAGREAARRALCAFARATAGPLLVAGLRQVSREIGLPFVQARVRRQRTRWGSCTAGGRVSLNVNLAFLPYALTRYVFVHELCHTRHQNHSARFWDAVRDILPECRELDAALRHAGHYVPLWFGRELTASGSSPA